MGWWNGAIYLIQLLAALFQSGRDRKNEKQSKQHARDELQAQNFEKIELALEVRRRERLLRRGADSVRAPEQFARD